MIHYLRLIYNECMATLTEEKQISNIIRKTIVESIQGVLTDPDYGLEIREDVVKRLKKYRAKIPPKLTSLNQIKRKYL